MSFFKNSTNLVLTRMPLTFLLLVAVLLFAFQVSASTSGFKAPFFSIALPPGWSLINGPFKKNGGETAILGRRDHKASIQLLYGPTTPEHFKSIVTGYAKSFNAPEPAFERNQASFNAERSGQQLHFLFCHDDSGKNLIIFIFNGQMSDMQFVFTGLSSYLQGMTPRPF